MQGVLSGRYRLERQLGKGGMGSVWLAEHLTLRSWVAVKLMDPAIAATPEGAERFRREAQAAASLRSAHVVQVLDYGVHETTPFLVMELLQGESLAGCLEREKRLTPERTLAIMTQVTRALGRAHAAGIVHRDLKPDNVFLVREDDQELVKILDFGIAKTPQAQFGGMETRTGVTMGTPYYMSPEQVEGKKAVDFRTDLWAIAVITSECMTGLRPFDGSTFGELLLNICARPVAPPSSQGLHLPGFDAWFAKATNRDPEQRFSSAQELATSLRDVIQQGGQGSAYVPPAGGPPATRSGSGAAASVSSINTSQNFPSSHQGRARPWLLLGAVLAVLAAGMTAWLLRSRAQSAVPRAAAVPAALDGAAEAPPSALLAPPSAPAREAMPSAAKANAQATPGATSHKSGPETVASAAPAEVRPSGTSASSAAPASATPPSNVSSGAVGGAKVLRCYSDPFSGQIRPSGAGKAPDSAAFACKQDPFTGKYKRL